MIVLLVVREFRPDPGRHNVRAAIHQVKLTLMIVAIRLSDDQRDAPTAALFRCAGTSWPFRARGGSLRDLAAGAVDADQGDGGSAGWRPARAERAPGRA